MSPSILWKTWESRGNFPPRPRLLSSLKVSFRRWLVAEAPIVGRKHSATTFSLAGARVTFRVAFRRRGRLINDWIELYLWNCRQRLRFPRLGKLAQPSPPTRRTSERERVVIRSLLRACIESPVTFVRGVKAAAYVHEWTLSPGNRWGVGRQEGSVGGKFVRGRESNGLSSEQLKSFLLLGDSSNVLVWLKGWSEWGV